MLVTRFYFILGDHRCWYSTYTHCFHRRGILKEGTLEYEMGQKVTNLIQKGC